ncbi:hypothetical protein BHE74_00019383 [Ensete ventricosum]|nr:hypothetical protein GW17_00045314 [Ensete ventricosum]RWW72787.1 hypothetical protein BHE74_00019383 [Ensete ventricosum]
MPRGTPHLRAILLRRLTHRTWQPHPECRRRRRPDRSTKELPRGADSRDANPTGARRSYPEVQTLETLN